MFRVFRGARLLRWLGLLCSLPLFSMTANAQEHRDISFVFVDGKVTPSEFLSTATFPVAGISKQFTSNPGFASERDQGGGGLAGEQLVYNVLDDLLYWSDGQFRQPNVGTSIRIQNNPPATVPDTIVTSDSGAIEGQWAPFRNRIGQASAGGDFHSHLDFYLEPMEPEDPEQAPWTGAYGLKLSLETNRVGAVESDPLVIVFNFGLASTMFEQAVRAFESRWLSEVPGIAGDFNGNATLDAADIDLLTQTVREGRFESQFDLDQNGAVDAADRTRWIEVLKKSYFGDANLDGEFNSADFIVVFQQGEYEDTAIGNSTWADGDWNGDGEFDTADFIRSFQGGGFEQGPRPATVSVPEPMASWWLVLAWCTINKRRRETESMQRTSVTVD